MASRARRDKSNLQEILAALRTEMPRLEQTYHVKSLGVFGPYATGKERPGAYSTWWWSIINFPA